LPPSQSINKEQNTSKKIIFFKFNVDIKSSPQSKPSLKDLSDKKSLTPSYDTLSIAPSESAKPWLCDVCSEYFEKYDEAVKHELTCSYNPTHSSKFNKTSSKKLSSKVRVSQPREQPSNTDSIPPITKTKKTSKAQPKYNLLMLLNKVSFTPSKNHLMYMRNINCFIGGKDFDGLCFQRESSDHDYNYGRPFCFNCYRDMTHPDDLHCASCNDVITSQKEFVIAPDGLSSCIK